MKKNVLMLALAALCASCAPGESPSPSSSIPASIEESASSAEGSPSSEEASSSSLEESASSEGASSSLESSSEIGSSEISAPPISSEEVAFDEVKGAAESAKSVADSIASGTITQSQKAGEADASVTEIAYEFGNDENGVTYHAKMDEPWAKSDLYLLHDENGDVVAISKSESGEISKPFTAYEEANTLFQNYAEYGVGTAYGAEGFAVELASLAEANVNKDLVFSKVGSSYSFSFGYFASLDAYSFYKFDVSFALGKGGELAALTANIATYYSGSFLLDDEKGTMFIQEGKEASSITVYQIQQAAGERSFVSPYKLSDFILSSFSLSYNGAELPDGGSLEIALSDYPSISVTDIAPSTGSLSFDPISVTVVSGDASGLSASCFGSTISLYPSAAGDYALKIATKNVSKTLNVTVKPATPASVNVTYFTKNQSGYTSDSLGSSFSAIAGVEYLFKAGTTPFQADQSTTFSVEEDPSTYRIEKKMVKVNEWTDEAEMVCFTPLQAGQYHLTFASASAPEVKKQTVFTVREAPSLKDFFSKEYAIRINNGVIGYWFAFSPSQDGLSGSVQIEDKVKGTSENATYALTKTELGYDIALTHVSGEEFKFSLALGQDYNLFVALDPDSAFLSSLSEVTPAFLFAHKWSGQDGTYKLTMTFTESGQGTAIWESLNPGDDYVWRSFSFAYDLLAKEEGEGYDVTLSSMGSDFTVSPFLELPYAFSVDKDISAFSISFSSGEQDYSYSMAPDYTSSRG